jgi:hypothetical protein
MTDPQKTYEVRVAGVLRRDAHTYLYVKADDTHSAEKAALEQARKLASDEWIGGPWELTDVVLEVTPEEEQ